MSENIETCPWCDGDIPLSLGFDTLGSEFICPHCGNVSEVEGDYGDSDGGWYFTLVRV